MKYQTDDIASTRCPNCIKLNPQSRAYLRVIDVQAAEGANPHVHLNDPYRDEEIGEIKRECVRPRPSKQRTLTLDRNGIQLDLAA